MCSCCLVGRAVTSTGGLRSQTSDWQFFLKHKQKLTFYSIEKLKTTKRRPFMNHLKYLVIEHFGRIIILGFFIASYLPSLFYSYLWYCFVDLVSELVVIVT